MEIDMSTTEQVVTGPRMLTTEDLVTILGVTPQTIRRWREAGQMPQPVRFGRRVIRWRQADIDAWLAAGTPDQEQIQKPIEV
jgi:predicted DNA-binding transcriptional regulator AlpA